MRHVREDDRLTRISHVPRARLLDLSPSLFALRFFAFPLTESLTHKFKITRNARSTANTSSSTEDYKNAGFYHVFSYHYFYPCCPEESQGILDLLAPLNRLRHLPRLQHEQHCVAKKNSTAND